MKNQILFSPDLAINSATFIETWNSDPACHQIATAKLETVPNKGTFDPSVMDGIITLINTLTVGIVTNALYDLIKAQLVKQGVRVEIEYMELTQPDGTKLVVFKRKEE